VGTPLNHDDRNDGRGGGAQRAGCGLKNGEPVSDEVLVIFATANSAEK
jgi:hypothetical protein